MEELVFLPMGSNTKDSSRPLLAFDELYAYQLKSTSAKTDERLRCLVARRGIEIVPRPIHMQTGDVLDGADPISNAKVDLRMKMMVRVGQLDCPWSQCCCRPPTEDGPSFDKATRRLDEALGCSSRSRKPSVSSALQYWVRAQQAHASRPIRSRKRYLSWRRASVVRCIERRAPELSRSCACAYWPCDSYRSPDQDAELREQRVIVQCFERVIAGHDLSITYVFEVLGSPSPFGAVQCRVVRRGLLHGRVFRGNSTRLAFWCSRGAQRARQEATECVKSNTPKVLINVVHAAPKTIRRSSGMRSFKATCGRQHSSGTQLAQKKKVARQAPRATWPAAAFNRCFQPLPNREAMLNPAFGWRFND